MRGHDHHDGDGHAHGAPHEPDPPEPRRLIPESELLTRGLALAGVAGGLGLAGWQLLKAGRLFAVPLVLVLAAGAALSAWAAAIHLTGGERFDDHPLV